MSLSVTGEAFADQAMSERYTGVPYSELDCQAFVEKVLEDCGVRTSTGRIYNWKGSNDMWRNALDWKGTLSECKKRYGCIPVGSWVFIVKNDGGEKERGYTDNQGNASHVGIYVQDTGMQVRDSTKTSSRDGVGYRKLSSFTHAGIPKMVYIYNPNSIVTPSTEALEAVKTVRNPESSDTDYLKALETLTKYLKGV